MIDYSQYHVTPAVPEASSMIETFRAIGYSLEAAIADVIDNSISANAKNIWINFEWKGSETWLAIQDDGHGMNNEELVQAMKPGSRNPLHIRDSKDLGRFGLGLKTASFSQCRKLSVISHRTDTKPVYWTWDLDFIKYTGKWNLINYLPHSRFESEITKNDSGTIVIWNDIDRLVKNFDANDKKALEKFLIIIENVKKHLSMVFHRFIESGKIKLYLQNRTISPWNPFLQNEPATQGFPEESLFDGKIMVKGYVLPHKSKISSQVYSDAEGPKGWNEQQGFYIYRNERLLVAGDWLGMFRKEEHYKLARIKIDLPNSLDEDWQIDIKKSVARPPLILRDQLKAYAGQVRNQAVEIYRHRGKSVRPLPGQKFTPLWLDSKRGDSWSFKVNREHPLITEIKTLAKSHPDQAINSLLSFIEETIPVRSIYIKEAEVPEKFSKPFEGIEHDSVLSVMKLIFQNLTNQGKNPEQAKALILNLDPFNQFPHLLELID